MVTKRMDVRQRKRSEEMEIERERERIDSEMSIVFNTSLYTQNKLFACLVTTRQCILNIIKPVAKRHHMVSGTLAPLYIVFGLKLGCMFVRTSVRSLPPGPKSQPGRP